MRSAFQHNVLQFLVVFTACSCARPQVVLQDFPEAERIEPFETIDTEPLEIFGPYETACYGDWMAVGDIYSDYSAYLVNLKNGRIIPCFRKGRGPNELASPSLVTFTVDSLFVFDLNTRKRLGVSVAGSIASGEQDVVQVWSPEVSDHRWVYTRMRKIGEGDLLIAGLFTDDVWYERIGRDGKSKGSVRKIEFEESRDYPDRFKGEIFSAPVFSVSPDGSKLVCAMYNAGAFSISSLEDNGLREVFRKVYYGFDNYVSVADDAPAVLLTDRERLSPSFLDVDSDNQYIYLLYRGLKGNDSSIPNPHGDNLLVYDWGGQPVRRYKLSEPVGKIHKIADTLYCCRWSGASKILKYKL